jgi:alanine-synthesizing transaminase
MSDDRALGAGRSSEAMTVAFSRRVEPRRDSGRLEALFAELRAGRADLVDLTETNPTRVGLAAPAEVASLVRGVGSYAPEAFGPLGAREAIARFFAARHGVVDASRIVLSASTSEAYSWLFKLLCDPGDDVLVPTPSYPLFELLAGLESIATRTYALDPHEGYRIDVDSIARAIGPRTRAIVVVSPNNPTGTMVRRDDAASLVELARSAGLPLVVDEVFGLWQHGSLDSVILPSFWGNSGALTFVLGGLSKLVCAPQLKLGWTAVSGPESIVRQAVERLELVADTYLSVGAPVAAALPAILDAFPRVHDELSSRLATNLAALDSAIARAGSDLGVRRLPSHGGWTALVRVPRVLDEDAWVETLARDAGVLVQPGWYFDLDDGGTLVLSTILEPDRFARGVDALIGRVREVAR